MRIAGTSLKPLEVWRRDVTLREANVFGRSLLTSVIRGGAGGRTRAMGPRPDHRLVLYEMEVCPFSRMVREAVSELDLDVLIKPCPPGEVVHRDELRALRGSVAVPFLVERAVSVKLGESALIVRHLYDRYGQGRPPWILRGGFLATSSSMLASAVRGQEPMYRAPRSRPTQPLELWNYEASPYCRLVRERLGALGLPYLSRNLARHSPRRLSFEQQFGRIQFPRLADLDTGVALFETADILAYLEQTYGSESSMEQPGLHSIASP